VHQLVLLINYSYVVHGKKYIYIYKLDTHFTFTYTLLRFSVSTCFGHYLPIIRRQYTDTDLVTIGAVVDVGWSQDVRRL
jgi:hypothetical protein